MVASNPLLREDLSHFQGLIHAAGLFLALEGDALTCDLGQARPGRPYPLPAYIPLHDQQQHRDWLQILDKVNVGKPERS